MTRSCRSWSKVICANWEAEWPVLHLHRIKLDSLEDRSALERDSIRATIQEKLETLFASERRQSWS